MLVLTILAQVQGVKRLPSEKSVKDGVWGSTGRTLGSWERVVKAMENSVTKSAIEEGDLLQTRQDAALPESVEQECSGLTMPASILCRLSAKGFQTLGML